EFRHARRRVARRLTVGMAGRVDEIEELVAENRDKGRPGGWQRSFKRRRPGDRAPIYIQLELDDPARAVIIDLHRDQRTTPQPDPLEMRERDRSRRADRRRTSRSQIDS